MLIALIFVLFVGQFAESSELFFNIKKLTTSGQHSLPRFSSDNRYIYFTASGGDYEKECDEIYRLDLKYMDKVDEPGRISRVSTGFGRSTSAAPPYESEDQSTFFESSFEKALNIQNFNPTSDNHGCPQSAFSHIEHFPNTYIYEINNQNRLQRVQDTLADGSYYVSPARSGSKLAYTRNCQTTYEDLDGEPYTSSSTCLVVDGHEDPSQYTNPPVLYDYFNFAPKQTDQTNIRVSYLQKINLGDMDTIRYVFPLNSFYLPELIWNGTDLAEMNEKNYCSSLDKLYSSFYTNTTSGHLHSMYTIMDSNTNGNKYIYSCDEVTLKETLMTTYYEKYLTQQAVVSPDNKRVAFVRQDKSESEYQLYVADLDSNVQLAFGAKLPTDEFQQINADISTRLYVPMSGKLGRVRLSHQYGDVYYEESSAEGANCKQIYNVHTYFDDFSSPRLLSTGLGSVDGFDIFVQNGKKKIVYAGDFLKTPKDQDKASVHKCYLSGCDDPNKANELQQFCQSTSSTKYFGPSFDLFVTNIYGNVEKRLTTSNNWNGEVAVDQLNGRIYYSKVSQGRIDIVYRQLDGSGSETAVTSNLPAGYRGGVSIAGNNKILYHAYIPQAGNELTNFQHILDTYKVVDTHKLEIYQFDLSNQQEHQITQLGKKSQNPAYTRDGKILFETNYNQADEKTSAIYRINLDGTGLESILVSNSDTYRSVSIGSDTNTDFVFIKETGTTHQLQFGGYQAPPPSLPTTEQPTTIVNGKSTTATAKIHRTEKPATTTAFSYTTGGGNDDGSSADHQVLSKLLIGVVLLKCFL